MLNRVKDAILEQFDWVQAAPRHGGSGAAARPALHHRHLHLRPPTHGEPGGYLGWFELSGSSYQYDEELPKAIEKVTKRTSWRWHAAKLNHYAIAPIVPGSNSERR